MSLTGAEVMKQAIGAFSPSRVYALFSGGHDSLASTHFAMAHGAQEVVHINTGIGIKQTREFVRETCRQQGWPLRELHPPELTYRELVMKFGFPGAGAHYLPYRILKERALEKLVRESKRTKRSRVMLCTGVRRQESAIRMGYVQPVYRKGAFVWVAPRYDDSKLQNNEYLAAHGLPRSPVVDFIHMSGECLCGAFAHPGEREEIRLWFPEAVAEIEAIEAEARSKGVKRCEWGWVNPKEQEKRKMEKPKFMPMCVGCEQGIQQASDVTAKGDK